MTLIIVILVLVVLAVVGFGVAVATSSKRDYSKANQVVPGQRSKAPPSWAGAQTPEARMHRRLRDAVAAMHNDPRDADITVMEARIAIEAEAVSIDERLIAAAALGERHRATKVAAIEPLVVAVEDAVAAVIDAQSGGDTTTVLTKAVEDATSKLRFLDEAHAELEAAEPGLSASEIIEQIQEQIPAEPPERPDEGGTTSTGS